MKATRVISIVAVILLAALLTAGGARLDPLRAQSPDREEAGVSATTSPLLQYQGRLTDPGSGQAVADGSYSMTFRLYTLASGGTALWTETKDVAVQGGLFSTVLGDTTALTQSLFNGQELWLGVKVGADDEATPRQRILPVAYALSLVPGAVVQADSSSATLQLTNLGSGEALRVNGQTTLTGNLTISGSLSGGSHSHSGGDISSGTVAEVRIDAAIARDSEILPTVLAGDGAGSTLDADLLDGQHASAFLTGAHTHSGADITTGTVAEARIDAALARDGEILPTVLANDGAGSTLDADLLDGQQASSFFALNEDETVTGRPLFNGGTPGVTPPFTVDSDLRVDGLNADLVDGYHASTFSFDGHDHDGSQITSGIVDEPRIHAALARDGEVDEKITLHQGNASAHHPRYTDDEAWGAVLLRDGSGSTLNADLLDGLDSSFFAGSSHVHDHGALAGLADDDHPQYFNLSQSDTVNGIPAFNGGTSGSTPPFSVDSTYPVGNLNADLLDGSHATAFAGATHDHVGQSWVGSFGGYGLSVQNTNTSGDGIRGYSSSSSQLDGGLYGVSSSSGSGVVGTSSSGSGVYGTGGTGVYGTSSAYSGQGVQGHGSGALTEGVLGTSAQATGVYGIADASTGSNAIGVWGQTANTWGLFTYQQLGVGGCTGCTIAYVAQSEDAMPLEVGDIVSISGIAAPLAGGQTPVLTVSRATDTDQGLLGVVRSRAVVDTAQALVSSADGLEREGIEIASGAQGNVAPGDYLFVVVQGLVQVRVDASVEAVEVGDPIGPSAASGAAHKADLATATAPVVGQALEPLPGGTGLVWVLVLGR